jgi:hypothetical protein
VSGPAVVEQLRLACLALPEVTEKLSHGTPAFFVRKQFLTIWPNGHHDHDFAHLWCAAPPGAQEALVTADPTNFFRPPYVGHRGWLGVRLDQGLDLEELRSICEQAYVTVAPKTLADRVRR